jgi:hypothetical protein
MSSFWLMLLLKIAMTAGIVVAASLIVERSGPFIGSMVAALPTAGGAALIILAMDHSPDFIAQSRAGAATLIAGESWRGFSCLVRLRGAVAVDRLDAADGAAA